MNISIVCTLTPEDDENLYWQWAQNVQKSAEILKIAMNSSFFQVVISHEGNDLKNPQFNFYT